MHVIIRKATDDVVAILPLWRELMEFHSSFDPQYQLVLDAATQAEAHLRAELVTPTSLLLVAIHDSAVVGYCRASIRQQSPVFEPRAHGFISELHVSPGCRRQGIGRNLFRFVLRWLGGQSVRRVELVTLNANDTSSAFWQSVGCETHAERRSLEFVVL